MHSTIKVIFIKNNQEQNHCYRFKKNRIDYISVIDLSLIMPTSCHLINSITWIF